MTGVSEHDLGCGLRVILESMSGVRSASASLLVPAGAAADPEDRQGLSALWEELLHRGAGGLDSRGQADAFDRLGVNRSIGAGARYMRLGVVMPGDRTGEALGLLFDTARRPRFDADSIAPARDLALQAIESLRDDPRERAVLAARARRRAAPFDRSGLGVPDHLAAATRGDLVEQWRVRAVPEGSILAVAGAFDVDAALAALSTLVEGWTGRFEAPRPGGDAPRGYAHELDESNQVQIIVLGDGPPEPDPDAWHERVVAAVLSGGMSGRLFTEVREKRGLCYAVSAGYRADADTGVVSAYVGTTPERAQESLDVLRSELDRLGTPGGAVTREEFDRAVVGMKSRLVFKGESTGARAAGLAGDAAAFGRPRTLEELAAAIDAVTLDGVNEYLGRREPGRRTIQTLGPAPLTPPE